MSVIGVEQSASISDVYQSMEDITRSKLVAGTLEDYADTSNKHYGKSETDGCD